MILQYTNTCIFLLVHSINTLIELHIILVVDMADSVAPGEKRRRLDHTADAPRGK